ncbi:MAG TPA: MBL fold metallo-hydrolase [Actinomycetota bacterium]|nr:MBL fold metallo-hydrolase [Actinomycetota bacterium]
MADVRWRRAVGPVEITKLSVGPMDNNVYVLASGGEAVLIDGSNEADAILSELGDKRLTTIVQTHGHGDHVVALPALVEKTSAPVLVHPGDATMIPVPTGTIGEGDTVKLGPVELRVLHTPGHTPGSICLVLERDGQILLFSGDTLFPGGPGGTFGSREAFEQIMSGLENKLFALDDDTQVLPGHGDDTTIGDERPHLSGWRQRGW